MNKDIAFYICLTIGLIALVLAGVHDDYRTSQVEIARAENGCVSVEERL